jgi:hypothetical protein
VIVKGLNGALKIGRQVVLSIMEDDGYLKEMPVLITKIGGAVCSGVYYLPMGRGNSYPYKIEFQIMACGKPPHVTLFEAW